MATLTAIRRIKTRANAPRVFSRTPKLHRRSRAQAVSSFYGRSYIQKGALHKQLGIAPGNKIPLSVIQSKLNKLKRKKKKTARDIKTERRLVFAINAKTRWGRR